MVPAPTPDTTNCFVLEVFDCILWCPIAQAPFHVSDVDALRSMLGSAADQDPALEYRYPLNDERIAAIVSAFDTFDPRQLRDNADLEIWLYRLSGGIETLYLVHTNYELPLLLDDRKKLARLSYVYPREEAFDGEEAFNRWVANGVLHKEVVDEPFENPIGTCWGPGPSTTPLRARSGAFLLLSSSTKHRASPEAGMSISNGLKECCSDMRTGRMTGGSKPASSAEHLAERRSAARSRRRGWRGRSWPACARCHLPTLSVITYWYERKTADADLKQLLEAQPGGVAVLRFTVAGRYAIPHIIATRGGAAPGRCRRIRFRSSTRI